MPADINFSRAVPYTVIIYPLLFIVFPRLWYVSRKHGYITAADFVRGRFGNRWLALAVTLTGGIWIIQTLPAVMIGLYTRWFNPWALLVGWTAGTLAGTWMAADQNFNAASLENAGWTFLYTLILNLGITIVLTPVFNTLGGKQSDETVAADYYA